MTICRDNRTEVISVVVWEPDVPVVQAERKTPVAVTGQVHRRFLTDAEGRHSRMEVVGKTVTLGGASDWRVFTYLV